MSHLISNYKGYFYHSGSGRDISLLITFRRKSVLRRPLLSHGTYTRLQRKCSKSKNDKEFSQLGLDEEHAEFETHPVVYKSGMNQTQPLGCFQSVVDQQAVSSIAKHIWTWWAQRKAQKKADTDVVLYRFPVRWENNWCWVRKRDSYGIEYKDLTFVFSILFVGVLSILLHWMARNWELLDG